MQSREVNSSCMLIIRESNNSIF